MHSLNLLQLIGNVGGDPDVRSMSNGGRMVSFSIATTESWVDKQTGQPASRTMWHKVVTFNEFFIGLIERSVRKGMRLYVSGQSETRKWTDANGQDRYTTELVMKWDGRLILLDRPAEGIGDQMVPWTPQKQNKAYNPSQYNNTYAPLDGEVRTDLSTPDGPPMDDMDDDIPF